MTTTKTLSEKPIQYVCAMCASEDVRCDAVAVWSVAAQMWVVRWVHDETAYCKKCQADTKLKQVPAP